MKSKENQFHSSHHWRQAIKEAYKGCKGIEKLHFSGPMGIHDMRNAGWKCGLSKDPYDAPNGAFVFADHFIEVHVKTPNIDCFVSDFRHKYCQPISATHHALRKTYGWCQPWQS
jgi:hypothetical protein